MTQTEFDIINSIASQLQHFVDGDNLQMPRQALQDLLDQAEKLLYRGRCQLIAERDYGHQQSLS